MAHDKGIITAPIDVLGDVAALLGEPSGDVATLCMSKKINPFALYCPRKTLDNPGLMLDDKGFLELKDKTKPETGSWDCPGYGVWVPKLDIPNLAPSKYDSLFQTCRKTWYIARPTENSWKNIAHFDGYDHYKEPVNPVVSVSLAVEKSTDNDTVNLSVIFSTPAPDGRVMSVSNLFKGNWYFGFIAFRGTDSRGWTQSDKVIIISGINAINGNSVAFAATCSDIIAKNTEYYYRIIPFVCNKPGLKIAAGGSLSSTSEGLFYGIRINEDWAAYAELSVGSTEGDVFAYFRFNEGTNKSNPDVKDNHYPNPKSTPFKITNSSGRFISPQIKIAYGEHDRGMRLLDKYYQIDFEFIGTPLSGRIVKSATWKRGTAHQGGYFMTYDESSEGDIIILRDKTNDTSPALENELFFYSTDPAMHQFLNAAMADDDWPELVAYFHYVDEKGNHVTDSSSATWIPDVSRVP